MRSLEVYQHEIEKRIAELNFPSAPENLYDPMRYFLSLGGKRMRPVLVLMGHELFGGDHTKVLSPAIATELFHNFTLMHDDIMDHAALRRGKATIHEKWNSNIAILSGDALMIESYKLLMECDPKFTKSVFEVFNRTALEVCEGQVMDMDFEIRNDVSITEYIEMIRLKTAVLLGCCLEIGAVLAGAGKEDARKIYEFGINLGIAFQLQDDLLDAFGDKEKFGKMVGGDIAANKKTFLYLKTLEIASETDKNHLHNLTHFYHENKIEQVLSLYEKYQIKKLTGEIIQSYMTTAFANLESIKVNPDLKQPLFALAHFLMRRES